MLTSWLQSLKETFADGLPAEIEKVKKLRKYVDPALCSITCKHGAFFV